MLKKISKFISALLLSVIVFLLAIPAMATTAPLPVDQAFALSVYMNHPDEIIAEWQIAPGYFLYAKKIQIQFVPDIQTDMQLPQGEFKYDSRLGKYEVFSGIISVPISFASSAAAVSASPIKMQVDYQGCAREGFCYPPIQRTWMLNFTDNTVIPLAGEENLFIQKKSLLTSLLTDQNGVVQILQSQHIVVVLLIFIGLGLLLAFTPCVLPLVPILASIIVGQKPSSTFALEYSHLHTRKAFFLSLAYVLGTAVTYACAGILAAILGSSLQVWLQQPWVIIIMSAIFVLLALSLFGLYDLALPPRWQTWLFHLNQRQRRGTYLGVFLMGVISTLVVSPCVTAPLVGVLMYISQTGSKLLGASALFAMGIGMGIPLMLIGMSAGKWLPRTGPWLNAVKKVFGILMLIMAGWLFARAVPAIFPQMSMQQTQAAGFVIVNDLAELHARLAAAKLAQQPVLLDFYADWCEPCVAMDKEVFTQAKVRQALTNYVLLRVDLSVDGTSTATQTLLKEFNVIAPPTIIFFAANGRELTARRIVGEVSADEFLQRIGK